MSAAATPAPLPVPSPERWASLAVSPDPADSLAAATAMHAILLHHPDPAELDLIPWLAPLSALVTKDVSSNVLPVALCVLGALSAPVFRVMVDELHVGGRHARVSTAVSVLRSLAAKAADIASTAAVPATVRIRAIGALACISRIFSMDEPAVDDTRDASLALVPHSAHAAVDVVGLEALGSRFVDTLASVVLDPAISLTVRSAAYAAHSQTLLARSSRTMPVLTTISRRVAALMPQVTTSFTAVEEIRLVTIMVASIFKVWTTSRRVLPREAAGPVAELATDLQLSSTPLIAETAATTAPVPSTTAQAEQDSQTMTADEIRRLDPLLAADVALAAFLAPQTAGATSLDLLRAILSHDDLESFPPTLLTSLDTLLPSGIVLDDETDRVRVRIQAHRRDPRASDQRFSRFLVSEQEAEAIKSSRIIVTVPAPTQDVGYTRPLTPEPETLNEERAREEFQDAFERILELAPAGLELTAAWIRIVVRLVARILPRIEADAMEWADGIRSMLLQFILGDLHLRSELALAWLQEEWLRVGDSKKSMDRYTSVVSSILGKAATVLIDARDRLLVNLYLDLPKLDNEAIWMLSNHLASSTIIIPTITTLRELAVHRPSDRDTVLEILLAHVTDRDRTCRSASIVTVKKLLSDMPAAVVEKVEAHAEMELRKILAVQDIVEPVEASTAEQPDSSLPMDVDSESTDRNPAVQWSSVDVVRHTELYFALCTRNHDMLKELCQIYTDCSAACQDIIRTHVQPLIRSIGSSSDTLLQLIEDHPLGGETLVLQFVETLLCGASPSPRVTQAFKAAIVAKDLPGSFIIPIIYHLEKADALELMPRVVALLDGTEGPRATVGQVMFKLMHLVPPEGASTAPAKARVSPTEMLVMLHDSDATAGLKRTVEATQLCLSRADVFNSECLAVVIQQLSDRAELPALFMRTVMQSMRTHPMLAGFIVNLLQRLVQKRVWEQAPVIWQGFARCVKILSPRTIEILRQLPRVQFDQVLRMEPELKQALKEWIARKKGTVVGGGTAPGIGLAAANGAEGTLVKQDGA